MQVAVKHEQKMVRLRINNTIDQHCKNCEIVKQNRKRYGIFKAFDMCLADCPIGKRIREYGRQLTGDSVED